MREITFIVLILFFYYPNAFAQCCTAGNPIGGDGFNDALTKNMMRLNFSYRQSLSEDYYLNNSKVDVPIIKNSSFNYLNLSANYGLNGQFTVTSEIGYFLQKKQELDIPGNKSIIARGFGDFSLGLRFSPIKTYFNASQFTIAAGTKIPVGNFSEETNGILIPLSLQPSSGALKYNFSAFYGKKFNRKRFGISMFSFIELSNTIEKEFLEFKYGTYYNFLLSGNYLVSKHILLITGLKYEYRLKDKRENGLKIDSSGGKSIYVSPQMHLEFFPKWILNLSFEVPVYKYVNGYQLTNKYSFAIGVIRNINFS
jgi:hypothetical protein